MDPLRLKCFFSSTTDDCNYYSRASPPIMLGNWETGRLMYNFHQCPQCKYSCEAQGKATNGLTTGL